MTSNRGKPHSDWRQRARAVRDYRSQHGDWCVGWAVPGHLATPPRGPNPLTADHQHPVARGGALHPGTYAILCRRCNSRKGARVHPPQPSPRSRVW
jgi:5-methylcytosine-specific restriction protein A